MVLLARNEWIPKYLAPFSLRSLKPSIICTLVKPYFASPGLSIIPLAISNVPPGLYLQLIVSGIPVSLSKNSMWVKSSRFIVPLSSAALINSSAGVALEENIISSPEYPKAWAKISSVKDEQSTPHPSSFRIDIIYGLGFAFTAKYSLNPLFHEKASFNFLAFSLIPFSSYI